MNSYTSPSCSGIELVHTPRIKMSTNSDSNKPIITSVPQALGIISVLAPPRPAERVGGTGKKEFIPTVDEMNLAFQAAAFLESNGVDWNKEI